MMVWRSPRPAPQVEQISKELAIERLHLDGLGITALTSSLTVSNEESVRIFRNVQMQIRNKAILLGQRVDH
jgi:hypothetical protein